MTSHQIHGVNLQSSPGTAAFPVGRFMLILVASTSKRSECPAACINSLNNEIVFAGVTLLQRERKIRTQKLLYRRPTPDEETKTILCFKLGERAALHLTNGLKLTDDALHSSMVY